MFFLINKREFSTKKNYGLKKFDKPFLAPQVAFREREGGKKSSPNS